MWCLWLSFVFCSVITAEATFGTPYLKSSPICKPWDCVNSKLGLPLSLPTRIHYDAVLKSLLPEEWHQAIDKTLDSCYPSSITRPRNYVNTCPGQALLHCTVDNLMENCPVESLRNDDGCYGVSSLAGTKNMFTQSRYQDLDKNLPKEKRSEWFMKHFFKAKCCNLPNFINSSVLNECGFSTFLHYYDEKPRVDNFMDNTEIKKQAETPKNMPNLRLLHVPNSERLEVFEIDSEGKTKIEEDEETDPLNCCNMEGFIDPLWISQCGFNLSWDDQDRLKIGDEDLAVTTTVSPHSKRSSLTRDITIVPLSCEKEACVFNKLNVLSETGSVNVEAFTKLLDNFTNIHPTWNKAKARVITLCLSKSSLGYDAECDINKVLSCTLDVLSENCPYGTKPDLCRHSRQNTTLCQISSSKYRPKNRRAICSLPNLVKADVLVECGLTSVSRMQYVSETSNINRHSRTSKYVCKDSTHSTLCLMNKMGVLNKYEFMDYFKMKSRIRGFTEKAPEWSAFKNSYMSVISDMPLYRGYCSSPKKLLNVVDAMLRTCPVSKRKHTQHCTKFFNEIVSKPQDGKMQNLTQDSVALILSSYNITPPPTFKPIVNKINKQYDFGILRTEDAPPVKTINVKPTKPTLVILPVYMRTRKNYLKAGSTLGPYKDGVFTSPSYKLHGKVPNANTTEFLPMTP